MADIKKVPAIRFKGFNDEWEECELGRIIEITSASRVHKNEWTDSGVPFFRSSDVVANYKSLENNKAYISFKLYEELSNKSGSVQKNDLLVTGGGSIGIPYLIKTNEPLYFKDADLLWLKNGDKLNGHFLYTFFSTLGFRRYVNSITHIGTISHYTVVQAKSTPIRIPEKAEQDDIGEFLLKLDKLISLHQARVNKLVNLKKAMLEKMFTKDGEDVPEIRFNGFEGAWTFKTLKELRDSNQISLHRGVVTAKSKLGLQGFPVYSSSVHNNGLIGYAPDYALDQELVSWSIDGGGNFFYRPKHKFTVTNVSGYLIVKSSEIDVKFLYYYLQIQHSRQHYDYSYKAHPSVIVNNYSLCAGSFAEQKKIGDYFQNLDELISLHQAKLNKLVNFKKACLEQMFV